MSFIDVTRTTRLRDELQRAQEEVQAANEALQTTNEALKSSNEELETMNEELRGRSDELNHLNAFLRSVLASLSAGAVVVNSNLDVLMWNLRAEDLWGLRATRCGRMPAQPRHRPAGGRAAQRDPLLPGR